MGSDALGAWRKVMAPYRRVYAFGHLQPDCRGPGSAPKPYARFEYRTGFSFRGQAWSYTLSRTGLSRVETLENFWG